MFNWVLNARSRNVWKFDIGLASPLHCVKSVRIRSYSGPHFSVIPDQNKSEYGHLLHSVSVKRFITDNFDFWVIWLINWLNKKFISFFYLTKCRYLRSLSTFIKSFNPLSVNPTKCSLPTNCLRVFEHFLVFVLKGLTIIRKNWVLNKISF